MSPSNPPSKAQIDLAKYLSSKGINCKTEHPVSKIDCGFTPEQITGDPNFYLDIALPEHKLYCEVDGFDFHRTPEQMKKNYDRRATISKSGWVELRRVTEKETKENIHKTARKIMYDYEEYLKKHEPVPTGPSVSPSPNPEAPQIKPITIILSVVFILLVLLIIVLQPSNPPNTTGQVCPDETVYETVDVPETVLSYYYEGREIPAPLIVTNFVQTNTADSFDIYNSINMTLPVTWVFRADGKVISSDLSVSPEGRHINREHQYYTPGIEPGSIYFTYSSSGSFEVKPKIITKQITKQTTKKSCS